MENEPMGDEAIRDRGSAGPSGDLGSAIHARFARFRAEFGDFELELPPREPIRQSPFDDWSEEDWERLVHQGRHRGFE